MKVLPFQRESELRRVLVLEDHDLLRSSMVRALSEIDNVAVVGVGTVQDALSEIDGAAPHLIVSDLDLPDGSGLELMQKLRGGHQPPIVFVSGHVNRFESQLNHYPGVVVLDKPLPARTLKYIATEQLEAEPEEASPFAAGDYIQLACLGRHSVRIDVRGASVRGSIHIRQGRLWAAAAGRHVGLPALRELTFTDGAQVTCSGSPADPGPSNLPDLPWEQLLLDLAKEHDEHTRKIPLSTETEEIDFSDIFEEHEPEPEPEPKPEPTPIVARPPVEAAPPAPSADDARFARLLDDAHDALLQKRYVAALTSYESAEAIRPDDPVVRGNLARLRELLDK